MPEASSVTDAEVQELLRYLSGDEDRFHGRTIVWTAAYERGYLDRQYAINDEGRRAVAA